MKKTLLALFSVMICSFVAMLTACDGCNNDEEQKKPEKLKDGIALVLTEGASQNIDLSEYISIDGTDYAYEVASSNTSIATVSVTENTATITAVKAGNATITASADEVTVSFAVTVNAKQISPVKADKTALVAELALEVTEQGDYTAESYAVYTQKLQTAKTVNAKADATQSEVDAALSELKTAREGLKLRVPTEVVDAEKSLVVISGLSKEITISDYIDAKNLSSLTYEVSSANAIVTVGEIEDGKFTVTIGETEKDVSVALTISAKYKGETKLTVNLTLLVKSEAQPSLKKSEVTQSVDIYALENKETLTIDFTQNVETNGVKNLVYTVTSNGNAVTLDENNRLVYNFDGNYSETATDVVFNVTVGYGEDKSISYVYTLKITDTTAYRVVNGGFDNGLDGWTMVGEIGAISETSTFWAQNFPIFNNGKYFAGNEPNKGKLTSSSFKVGGINKITFKLGAAGNKDCYITLEKADGTVLAIWRNTKFEDVVDKWSMEEIGKTQFACNLVTYVADLTAYAGETVKVVLHDEATSGFGFFNFDTLVTYYQAEAELPKSAVDVVNELADKSELQVAVDCALIAQGDYTTESFNAYTAKIAEAQAILDKVSATQSEVDLAKTAIEEAQGALEVRVPEEKAGAVKSFRLLAGGSKELAISSYVDENKLSSLTYEVTAGDKITVSEIADGKFTVTAGAEEVTDAKVTIDVKYKEAVVLTVEITVAVTNETAPTLNKEAIEENIDLFDEDNTESKTIDFASNVENLGELKLTYTVTMNGIEVELDENNSYTYNYESYTDTATEVKFAVKVSFNHNGTPEELNYSYTLNIKDTRAYRIANGGFDNGLDGWTLSNSNLGGVNNDETYWGNIPFNNDGNFFNAYYFNGEAKESAKGTLTSSPFTVGGSGWITYKLGGAKISDRVFLEIVEKDTGNILARYYNNAFSDDVENTKVRGCTLIAYKADLSACKGKTVYIRLVDGADSDYGLFFVDSFETYYPEAPTSGTDAVAVGHPDTIYDIYNGSFESNLAGWTLAGDIGAVTNTEKAEDWYQTNEGTKDGDYLFTFYYEKDVEENGETVKKYVNVENNIGALTSSMFVLKAGKFVSFKFGGGGNRNVFIELVNADSGSVIAVLHNDNCDGAKLISYSYDAGLTEDTLCYFRIVDNAAVGNYSCFVADDFRVNLDSAPDGSIAATNHISEYRSMVNGSFENGLDGWTMFGDLGGVVSAEKAEGWYQTNENTKDGNNLFTFYYEKEVEKEGGEKVKEFVNVEGNTGLVRSSAFILEKNGIISFRFGAAHNPNVYINVYTTGGKPLATFRNNAWTKDTEMVQYYYQFDNTEEISCYFEIVDNAGGGDEEGGGNYGCIVMDDFRVNLDAAPEGAVLGSANTK